MAVEQIQIEGFVGQNPKYASEKHPDMVAFSVGVSQFIGKNEDTGQWDSKTTWYNVASWDKNKSNFVFQRVFKGDKVVVIGKLSIRSYLSNQGEAKVSNSIKLEKIMLMSKEREGNNASTTNISYAGQTAVGVEQYYDNNEQVNGRFPLINKAKHDVKHDAPLIDDDIPF